MAFCGLYSGFFVLPALFYARLFQIPTVLSYHTHVPAYLPSYLHPWLVPIIAPILWQWIRFTHSLADLTLVTSSAIQKEFSEHLVPNVQVWKKGIDIERFHPRFYSESMRCRMMRSDSTTRKMASNSTNIRDVKDPSLLLLYLGRLATEKRIEKLRQVLENIPNSHLCIVGTGPHEAFLQQYFAHTSTAFLGELHGEELSQAYASADVFVFPSDTETLGFVVLEAMASGLPVVAANAGGIPDIIQKNGTTGILVDRDEQYTEYVRNLDNDVRLRRSLSAAGRQAVEQWTWNASMAQICETQYRLAQEQFQRRWQVRWIRQFQQACRNLERFLC